MNTPQIGANASRPAADPRALGDKWRALFGLVNPLGPPPLVELLPGSRLRFTRLPEIQRNTP